MYGWIIRSWKNGIGSGNDCKGRFIEGELD